MEHIAWNVFLTQLKLSSGCDIDIDSNLVFDKLKQIPELKQLIEKCTNPVSSVNKMHLSDVHNEIMTEILRAKSQSLAAATQTDFPAADAPAQHQQSTQQSTPEQHNTDHALPAAVYTPPKTVKQQVDILSLL